MKLSLPVKPYSLNQGFGENADYYAKFHDAYGNPIKGHNGADLMATHGEPVYAPCDGDAWYMQDSHGGDGIHMRFPSNAAPEYEIVLWHLCSKDDPQFAPKIPTDGSMVPVKRGDLIGYADNTGAPYESSGDHLHLGVLPLDFTGAPLAPSNGFGGCIDPMTFWDGSFASDVHLIPAVSAAVSTASDLVTNISNAPISNTDKAGLLAQLAQLLDYLKSFL